MLRRKKGITLLELIIVMGLMGLITLLSFSFYAFSTRTFTKGENHSVIQSDVRLAASFITEEIRNAYKIEILSAMPDTPLTDKKYIYAEGSNIKLVDSGIERDILHGTSHKLLPELVFVKNDTNHQVLSFAIKATYNNDEMFDVETEVLPSNIDPAFDITGISGPVISYSSPLTDSESVFLDKFYLDIKKHNLFLNEESSGDFTLYPPPVPSALLLPVSGEHETTITWSTNEPLIIQSNGTVNRPNFTETDDFTPVDLTATISKGSASSTKQFKILVHKLDELHINTSLPDAKAGQPYENYLDITGGDGVYTYTISDGDIALLDDRGLVLNTNGSISGIPVLFDDETSETVITFNLTVTDGIGNEVDGIVSLLITP